MSGRLRVLIDCTAIPANHAGVGRYVEGLLRGLKPEDVDLVLAAQLRDVPTLTRLVPHAEIHALRPQWQSRPARLLWEQLVLPFLAARKSVDLIHSPHYTFPVFWRGRRVVTVHDATFFTDPVVHTRLKRAFFQTWTRLSWRSATAVITPSRATAYELEQVLGPTRANVVVAILGVEATRFSPPSDALLDRFIREIDVELSTGWFAFLGTIEPRKNLSALLDAYKILRAEQGASAPKLLISGTRGWDSVATSQLDALEPNSGVHELGYLPVELLPALLGGSVAVVYPSLGEGFGLPVLEAMACGAAVITTRRLAIPEVGGDAVAYSGIDAPSIKENMKVLLLDVPARKHLGELAVNRAAQFTWRSTALAHVNAYLSAPSNRH